VRRVIVLGSSGSIGTQALDVIRANPELFELVGLATGSQEHVLREQAAEFGVAHTALGAEEAARLVRDVEADVVLNGITGSVGLGPTLAALETGRTLALANKESLIVGGPRVKRPRRSRAPRPPGRSSPSTRNTPRSRRRCAADPPTRSGAWSSRPRGARSAGAPGSPSSVSRPRRR
jgi:1-deoxy-D-xylulose 5-phosphate reductoisomerase